MNGRPFAGVSVIKPRQSRSFACKRRVARTCGDVSPKATDINRITPPFPGAKVRKSESENTEVREDLSTIAGANMGLPTDRGEHRPLLSQAFTGKRIVRGL